MNKSFDGQINEIIRLLKKLSLLDNLTEIETTLDSTIKTSVQDISTKTNNLDTTLTTISGKIATIDTNINTINTNVNTLVATVSIFYGSGTTLDDFESHKVEEIISARTLKGEYLITVRTTGDYVFITIPSNMTFNGAFVGSTQLAMTLVDSTETTKTYKSNNTQTAGNLLVKLV